MRIFHHYPAAQDAPERWLIRDGEAEAAFAARFEALVKASLDELPARFLAALDECPVVISDDGHRFGAYGLYHGATIARPEIPARIFIYRDTLTQHFGHDANLLAEQVRRVVRHELGHHLGFDEQGVADLGL